MKIAALSLMALGMIFYGFTHALSLLGENKCRKAFIHLLDEMKTGIKRGHPLPEIFEKFDDPYLEERGASDILRSGCDLPLLKALSADGISDVTSELSKEEAEGLTEFASALGERVGAEEELAALDKVIELMEKKRSECEKDNIKKAALSVKLGFLGALAVFVVFI